MENEPKRIQLSDDDLKSISKEDLIMKWTSIQAYVDHVEEMLKKSRNAEKLKSIECMKLKNLVLMNYSLNGNIKNDMTDSDDTIGESVKKSALTSSNSLVDPCVSVYVEQLKKELDDCRKEKENLQNELNGWKFSSDSNMGKRLILKCRKLLKENEELGKMISSGSLAKLEADLAYHKELLNEASENEQNIDLFVSEMDNEMDAMLATIIQLQQVISTSGAKETATEKNLVNTGVDLVEAIETTKQESNDESNDAAMNVS